ncbi:MAG: hypothetical protein ACYC6Y_19370 [Thermoguttaceae bacterium]
MPSTVNGIGTSYFLKQNRCYSIGSCENCGSLGWLSDYTTYKCVCVLFIPVIPYGRARVINYCPSCTRHRVMSHRNYADAVATQLSEAHRAWEADPANTGAVSALCNVLIATGQSNKVDELLQLTQATLPEEDAALIDLRRKIAAKKGQAALEAYRALVAGRPGQDGLVIEMLQLMTVIGRKKEIPPAIAEHFDANGASVFFMANAGDLALAMKDYETATRCYDRMFALKPQLLQDLRTNKAVRKAYKKVGRPYPPDEAGGTTA